MSNRDPVKLREYSRLYDKTHKLFRKKNHQEYYKKHKLWINKKNNAYYATHKKEAALRNNKSRVRKYFGISYEEYLSYFEQSNGYCAICGKHYGNVKSGLGLDHNHVTGKIRGVLCRGCNAKVAWLENFSVKVKEHLDRGI